MAFFPAPIGRAASDASIDLWEAQFDCAQAVMERIGMRDAQEDFEHPGVPEGHRLRLHCLYRLRRDDWRAQGAKAGS